MDDELLVVIPARYGSTRFPGKPLVRLKGAGGVERPLIEWTWRAAVAAVGADPVVVATDDNRIAAEVERFGGHVALTPAELRNGTERCAWLVQSRQQRPQLVVNFQGDSPLIPPGCVHHLVAFARQQKSMMATPFVECDAETAGRLRLAARQGLAGATCVVTDNASRALYFSKFPIPFGDNPPLKMHIGLYAYSPSALEKYLELPPSAAELSEGLEQLRFLDAGIDIDMLPVQLERRLWELNNPEDVALVEQGLQQL